MLMSVGVGFFGGCCLGFAFSFLRLRSDRTLQNPGDVSFHLQLREVGVIPTVRTRSLRLLLERARQQPIHPAVLLAEEVPVRPIEDGGVPTVRSHPFNSIALATWLRNPPELAEAFRSAMNSLLFSNGLGEQARVIVLTSPEAGDGKTTAATNLAVALAEIGRRVVLVDGDLRKPRLAEIFHLDCTGGLAKLLTEEDALSTIALETDQPPLSSFVHETLIANLFVLPTVATEKGISAKLHSRSMRTILKRLRLEFDVVIIDTPPMLHVSDARVLGWLADGVLLVFRSRKTTRESALAATECLLQDGIHVVGTILNDWNPRKGNRYGVYSSVMGAAS
jgi:capsular exopolysaccharide synthesis family protein